jgi:hypothetical protein
MESCIANVAAELSWNIFSTWYREFVHDAWNWFDTFIVLLSLATMVFVQIAMLEHIPWTSPTQSLIQWCPLHAWSLGFFDY